MRDINERFVWLGGKCVELKNATINVLSPTSQFGANVFEGVRCYWAETENQLYAFRLRDHHERLKNSMKLFRMEHPYSDEILEAAFMNVIKYNDYHEDIAVRQTVFVDGFGTWSSTGPINMFVSPIPKSRIKNLELCKIRCCVSSWERISDKNMSPRIKVGANYINSRMAQIEAQMNGYDSAIFLNNKGKVAEGPGSCLFIVRGKQLITAPLSSSILESITRDTILKLGEDLGYETLEREIERTELYISDEAFLCGSAMEITPILEIDRLMIGKGEVGKVTKELHKAYLEAATGKNKKFYDWLTPIY